VRTANAVIADASLGHLCLLDKVSFCTIGHYFPGRARAHKRRKPFATFMAC